MTVTRRHFIAGSSAVFLAGSPISRSLAGPAEKRNLIVVMLRGGMDGLSAVPYIGDDQLAAARPDILVRQPASLDGNFGLHPALRHFGQLWQENKAAVVHAASIPYSGRSHFEGQNLMESGGHTPYADATGWLGRGMGQANLSGLSLSLPMPLILRGEQAQDNFFPAALKLPDNLLLDRLAESYQEEPLLADTLQAIQTRPLSMMGGGRASERREPAALARVAGARLADPDGPSVAVFDIGGFDTHSAQGGDTGEHANQLRDFDQVIKALHQSLGAALDQTLIVSLTEFGRTLSQNGGSGTEHGYGTAVLLAGGLLKKAQVLTDWPGLSKAQLFEGRDLQASIDARAVYAAAMASCFGVSQQKICAAAFFGENLRDLTSDLFV